MRIGVKMASEGSIECPECGRRHPLRLVCWCLFLPYEVSLDVLTPCCSVREEEQGASRKEEGSVGKL